MEKIPTDYFAVVKWWISLKITDKLLAYLLAGIIAISTVSIRLYGTKEQLQRENLNARIECEQRVGSSVAAAERRGDSAVSAERTRCEVEKQNLFLQRTPEIKNRITKIESALKK